MCPHWLAGAGPLRAVAEQLLAQYDSGIPLNILHKALQFMVVQHRDLCTYLQCWIQDMSSRPGANPQDILDELERLLHSMWKA